MTSVPVPPTPSTATGVGAARDHPVPKLAVPAIAPANDPAGPDTTEAKSLTREDDTPERAPTPPTPSTWTGVELFEETPFPSSAIPPEPQQSTPPEALEHRAVSEYVARERGHPRKGAAAPDAPDLHGCGAARRNPVPELAVVTVPPAVRLV